MDYRKQSQTKNIMNIFFGILIFAVIIFPFYGVFLRNKIGELIKLAFDWFGKICFFGGGFFLLIAVTGIITRGGNWMKYAVIGIALLWVGCWCTGVALNIFGITIGESVISTQDEYINIL